MTGRQKKPLGHDRRRQWSLACLGLVQAVVAVLCLVAMLGQSRAQFFEDRFPLFDRRLFEPARPAPPPDNAKAPAPRKVDRPDGVAPESILVLGDSMADWLGYGLELAYQDSPDLTVVRRPRTWSSLIFNDNKRELRNKNNVDWPQLAKETLATEQPKFVVMMIGLSDRQAIREQLKVPEAKPAEGKPGDAKPGDAKAVDAKASDAKTGDAKPADGKAGDKQADKSAKDKVEPAKKPDVVDDELSPEQPNILAAEDKRPGGSYEFRSDKWADLYIKRIDETIAVLKAKGVPVLWVGLPSIRGPKSTADMSYLDDLFRSRAEKAGITYVDVWDGFVDDAGRFAVQGADVEGQYRRLRSADGIHFTSYGARKLAHYVEREIARLSTPTGPIAISIPVEPEQKPAAAAPGAATARPTAGPVIPLNAINANSGEDQLLGADRARQSIGDVLASKVLVKGEAQPVPAGRADDFAWPRRAPAALGADPVVALTTVPMTPMQSERPIAPKQQLAQVQQPTASAKPKALRQPQVVQRVEPRPTLPFFFFFGR